MLIRILIVVNLLLVVVVILAATRPSTLHVQRSIEISAPPERIFPLLDDFHQWPQWQPQDRDDPTMKRTYSGAANGVGAVSQWRGSGSTGNGRMEIVESVPNERVSVNVDFAAPFKVHNMNHFTLTPEGSATRVTWSMDGTNLFVMKVMSVFLNMDRMAGKHFEEGLQNLKTAAEKESVESRK